MYIGGTDDRALHHLFAEVIDNSMDEAVAGHATRIEVELDAEGYLSVSDNGRGIPIGPHPKEVEVARNKTLHLMRFERGKPIGKIKNMGAVNNRRGTKLRHLISQNKRFSIFRVVWQIIWPKRLARKPL